MRTRRSSSVPPVTQLFASVARIAAKGNRVVFEEDGGYIENKISGKKITTIKDRETYAIEEECNVSNTSEEDNELGFAAQSGGMLSLSYGPEPDRGPQRYGEEK